MTVLAIDADTVTPGVLGFLVVAALGLVLFFLVRSMNKQIDRIEAPSEDELRQAEWEKENRRDGDDDEAEQPRGAEQGKGAQPS